MAVDKSRIKTDNTEFLNATNQRIAERDAANDELNAFLDPLVTELGGDPNHLKFAAKKINYILENENEWASSDTLKSIMFNYEQRLKAVRRLAKLVEDQIKIRENELKGNDEIFEQIGVELQTDREQNLKIQQENAAIEAKIKAYEETVESIDKEIESLNNQNESNNNNKNRVNYNIIKSTMERKTATLDKIAELKGNLESNKLKLVSDADITARQNELLDFRRKQMEARTGVQEQKIYLINEFKKDKIKSLRDNEYNKHGKTDLWRRYHRKQAKLSTKKANILTETYRGLVHELVDDYDTIIIEKIDAFEMRKRNLSMNKAQNTGKNKRLALIKPYELSKIVESLVNKQNKTLIKVDPYKTSQVEYGTKYESKHELKEVNEDGKRIYVSAYTGKEVDRDYNAALNIKEWGLHPEKHAKLRDYPKLKANNLVEII